MFGLFDRDDDGDGSGAFLVNSMCRFNSSRLFSSDGWSLEVQANQPSVHVLFN